MVTRKRKGGLMFGKKRKNRTIKTQNRANVRDLTYKLAQRDFKKPGSSGLKFNLSTKHKERVNAYRNLARKQIEKKANNSRTRRRERLALMKRKIKGGKRKNRKRKKTKKRRSKN
tara:strand:+ start:125 stop:469 length:345 start_codon:yes stop_codon:yes gene_type:complete